MNNHCSVCNIDHTYQKNRYPKGSKVVVLNDFEGGIDLSRFDPTTQTESIPHTLIPAGSKGMVVAHCDDGRALIEFEAEKGKTMCSHSFHYPEGYFELEVKNGM